MANPYEAERTALNDQLLALEIEYRKRCEPILRRLTDIARHDPPPPMIINRDRVVIIDGEIYIKG